MVRRLALRGHECVVFDMSPKVVEEMSKEEGITGSSSLQDLIKEVGHAACHLANDSSGSRRTDNCGDRSSSRP